MNLATINRRYDREREAFLRSWANDCEAEAANGTFHEIGARCGFCVHAIPTGCRLRLIAHQKAKDRLS